MVKYYISFTFGMNTLFEYLRVFVVFAIYEHPIWAHMCLAIMFPWLMLITLPFAHAKWKGQPRSNIDTIDMFAENGE